jgi:hypothetical protein
VNDFGLEVEFLLEPDQRDHDFRLHLDAGFLHFGAISKIDAALTPLSATTAKKPENQLTPALAG